MKAPMTRMNFRQRIAAQPNKGQIALCVALSLMTFGIFRYSFLRTLVQGNDPLAGLSTRQQKDRYWLKYLYRV